MCSTTYIDVFELFHPLTNFFINEKHVLVSIHLFIYHKYTLLHKFVISKRLSLILISFFNFSISLIRRSNRDFKSLCNSRILFFLLQASSELYSGDVRAFIFPDPKIELGPVTLTRWALPALFIEYFHLLLNFLARSETLHV